MRWFGVRFGINNVRAAYSRKRAAKSVELFIVSRIICSNFFGLNKKIAVSGNLLSVLGIRVIMSLLLAIIDALAFYSVCIRSVIVIV